MLHRSLLALRATTVGTLRPRLALFATKAEALPSIPAAASDGSLALPSGRTWAVVVCVHFYPLVFSPPAFPPPTTHTPTTRTLGVCVLKHALLFRWLLCMCGPLAGFGHDELAGDVWRAHRARRAAPTVLGNVGQPCSV
jgi:hypothetical protein